MKRAYQFCHRTAWIGFFLTTALWLFWGKNDPVILGFAFLPFTALGVIAALLNRLLPKGERTEISLSFRGAVYHPYLDALLFLILNVWYLFPLHKCLVLSCCMIALYALLWLVLLLRTLYQRYFR